ncbi:MAG: hypothetical protein FVQ80_11470 [Planctomycetes bacterium]|nr:hypothetical protein [Planctomycetota bacterium]
MTTAFTDWTFLNTGVLVDPIVKGDYGELQYRTAKLINTNAGTPGRLFRTVTGFLNEDEVVQTPSCIILPAGVELDEPNISGNSQQIHYRFKVCIALKHPSAVILFQLVSAFSSIIRAVILDKAFGDVPANGVVIFDSVPNHYNTVVESEPIEPVAELRNGVLVFSSGLNVVYSVWYAK